METTTIYRRHLVRALNAKLWSGELSGKEYLRIRWKSRSKAFMEQFAKEVELAARVAGDWVSDLREWANKIGQWLLDHWPTILRILLSLLVLL